MFLLDLKDGRLIKSTHQLLWKDEDDVACVSVLLNPGLAGGKASIKFKTANLEKDRDEDVWIHLSLCVTERQEKAKRTHATA